VTGADGLVAVEGRLLDELLDVLREAVGGKRRILARLASREGLDAARSLEELGAFPAAQCAARHDEAIVDPSGCTAGGGCPVEAECPLIRGGGSDAIRASATAGLLASFVERWARPLPPPPVRRLADLEQPIARLLEASPRLAGGAPPRARVSLTVLAVAVRREGPFGAFRAFLRQGELERLAAHLPPGSGRAVPELRPVEAWIRRLTLLECALVER